MSHTFISSNIYLYQITWTKSSLWFSWLGLLFPPFTSKHKNSQNRLSCNKASLPWIRFLDTMPTQWILCSKWKKLWRKLDKFCGLSPGCHNYQIYDHAHTNTHCLYASFSLCIKQIYYSSENVLFKLWLCTTDHINTSITIKTTIIITCEMILSVKRFYEILCI